MKIAYILEVNPYENSGIIKKVKDQVSFWKKSGHDVLLLLSWPKTLKGQSLCIDGKLMKSSYVNWLLDGFLKNYLNKIFAQKKLRNTIDDYAPDLIYTRQNTWYPGVCKHLKKYPSILELNSVDSIEVQFYSRLKSFVYRFGRGYILNSVAGLVAVSPDILKHYSNYKHLKSTVVSNGINLAKYKKVKKPVGNSINLVFVGSKNTKWHGLEKLIMLANILPEYEFNIVGYEKLNGIETPNNVIFHGWVEKKDLEKIYNANHFGIGSFGNHMVGKNIDSTLKVREYLAYGLPVILGHTDVDFMNDESFILRVTNNKNNFIDKSLIKNFLNEKKNFIVKNNELKVIDSSTKELERINFFNQVIQNLK